MTSWTSVPLLLLFAAQVCGDTGKDAKAIVSKDNFEKVDDAHHFIGTMFNMTVEGFASDLANKESHSWRETVHQEIHAAEVRLEDAYDGGHGPAHQGRHMIHVVAWTARRGDPQLNLTVWYGNCLNGYDQTKRRLEVSDGDMDCQTINDHYNMFQKTRDAVLQMGRQMQTSGERWFAGDLGVHHNEQLNSLYDACQQRSAVNRVLHTASVPEKQPILVEADQDDQRQRHEARRLKGSDTLTSDGEILRWPETGMEELCVEPPTPSPTPLSTQGPCETCGDVFDLPGYKDNAANSALASLKTRVDSVLPVPLDAKIFEEIPKKPLQLWGRLAGWQWAACLTAAVTVVGVTTMLGLAWCREPDTRGTSVGRRLPNDVQE